MESLICRLDDDCDKLLICKLDLECKKALHFDTEASITRVSICGFITDVFYYVEFIYDFFSNVPFLDSRKKPPGSH